MVALQYLFLNTNSAIGRNGFYRPGQFHKP
jgi:hypothetical protein